MFMLLLGCGKEERADNKFIYKRNVEGLDSCFIIEVNHLGIQTFIKELDPQCEPDTESIRTAVRITDSDRSLVYRGLHFPKQQEDTILFEDMDGITFKSINVGSTIDTTINGVFHSNCTEFMIQSEYGVVDIYPQRVLFNLKRKVMIKSETMWPNGKITTFEELVRVVDREYKTLDFGSFEISVPEKWNKLKLQGIDSYVGGITTETNDSLIFDLGWFSNDITSSSVPMVYDSIGLSELTKKELKLLPNTKHLLVDSYTADIDYAEYSKYKFEYESIHCFKAKMIKPRNKGFGSTGIYIDSLNGSRENGNLDRFGFYGSFLSDKTQEDFIKALRTLKFKDYCE